MDTNTAMPQLQLNLLGKACAMNKRKGGNLKYVSIEKGVANCLSLKSFFDSFKVSDHDHETWYGEAKVAKDMVKD